MLHYVTLKEKENKKMFELTIPYLIAVAGIMAGYIFANEWIRKNKKFKKENKREVLIE